MDGKYGDADYTFEYQSWLRKHDPNSGNSNQDYDFGGIIRNQKPTALWVDWKEMGISGFVPFNEPKKFVIGDPTAECEIVDADLWYGDAPVLLPRVSAIRPLAKGLGSQIIHIVSEKVLDIFKKWGKVYTVSRTDLYVPVDEQSPPEKFARVEAVVTSEVTSKSYKLGLTFHRIDDSRSRSSGGSGGVLVSAVITDPFMAHGLKSDHASFTKSDYDENKSPDFNSDVPLQTEVTEVRYRVTRLGFEDAQHRRIGSMPVAVLEPNKWEGR